ncbi:MAG: type II toxin-antitoxin system Phd/YefM family antitoxin [Parcubacteria group bacterium]|nr:type II toxin-antitoxin system Phd/YefM family antitoxin [Parcubacteria group bacterium]
MNTATTLSITAARKKLFLIASEVEQENIYYTLTEYGKPKIVIVSSAKFERLLDAEKYPTVPQGCGIPSFVKDSGAQKYGAQKTSLKEKEIAKAQLYVDLVEKYDYPVDVIDTGIYVSVGGDGSRRFMEADMVVWDVHGNPRIVFAVAPFGDYERDFERTIKDLFEIGAAINGGKDHLRNLVYYSRSFANGRAQKKISVIDIQKYKTLADWEKSGRHMEKNIPRYSV